MAQFRREPEFKKFMSYSDFQLYVGPSGQLKPGAYFEFSARTIQAPLPPGHHAWFETRIEGYPVRFAARTEIISDDRFRLIVETVLAA
jgi:hypothetical protein